MRMYRSRPRGGRASTRVDPWMDGILTASTHKRRTTAALRRSLPGSQLPASSVFIRKIHVPIPKRLSSSTTHVKLIIDKDPTHRSLLSEPPCTATVTPASKQAVLAPLGCKASRYNRYKKMGQGEMTPNGIIDCKLKIAELSSAVACISNSKKMIGSSIESGVSHMVMPSTLSGIMSQRKTM